MTITPFIPTLRQAVRYYPLQPRRFVIGEVIELQGTEYVVVGRSIAAGQPYILIAEYHAPHHGLTEMAIADRLSRGVYA